MILKIDMTGEIPIYQQIRNQIVGGTAEGRLSPGESLPTVRQLAADIGVNPMTVNKAYALLKEEGMIEIDRRHGARISTGSMRGNAFSGEFDTRAVLLISEAYMRGASGEEIKKHFSELVDRSSGSNGGVKR